MTEPFDTPTRVEPEPIESIIPPTRKPTLSNAALATASGAAGSMKLGQSKPNTLGKKDRRDSGTHLYGLSSNIIALTIEQDTQSITTATKPVVPLSKEEKRAEMERRREERRQVSISPSVN